MEDQISYFWTEMQPLIDAFETQLQNLLLPSRQLQLVILLACAAMAYFLRRMTEEPIREWIRRLTGRTKGQLRVMVLMLQRLQIGLFVLLAWTSVILVSQVTPYPSRRYLLTLGATIATAWLFVGLAGRLIRNALLRRIVTWGLWIYVTLYYLGMSETVSTFLDHISIDLGGFNLSLLSVLKACVVTGFLLTGARLATQLAASRIDRNDDISPSMRVLVVKVLQIALYGAAFFIGLKAVGFDLTGLAVLSGAIGVGLGFGLQKVVSNLVSGVIILLDKSVKPGDVISLGDTFGWIEALGARYVSVVTRDGKEFLIPNEDLITGQVVNWSHSNDYVRLDLFFGTAYKDDPHKVRKVAIDAARSVPRVLSERPTVCHIVGFGNSSVDYILRFWIRDPVGGLTNITGDVYLALWDAFKANDISLPFPQSEVRLLPDSTITTRAQRHPD